MNKYVKETCKLGQMSACCRYLIATSGGFECAKLTTLKSNLDDCVNIGHMIAIGDNCEGLKESQFNILND